LPVRLVVKRAGTGHRAKPPELRSSMHEPVEVKAGNDSKRLMRKMEYKRAILRVRHWVQKPNSTKH
jgi:hypothetical protein